MIQRPCCPIMPQPCCRPAAVRPLPPAATEAACNHVFGIPARKAFVCGGFVRTSDRRGRSYPPSALISRVAGREPNSIAGMRKARSMDSRVESSRNSSKTEGRLTARPVARPASDEASPAESSPHLPARIRVHAGRTIKAVTAISFAVCPNKLLLHP